MLIFQKQPLKRRTILKAAGFTGLGMATTIIKPSRLALFESTKQLDLKRFDFQTVRLDRSGQEVARDRKQAQYISENLENGIAIEMVRIPAGKFVMGGTINNEIPQHQVRVASFFLAKFPVTQAQWQRVARLTKIKRDLFLFPSYFRSDNLPVESISWFDAMEFCERLSQKTGRTYRLPSEAEWEYASRGGTSSPFHFGPTISTDLANYYGIYPDLKGPTGKYRGQTTPVGYFQVANPFGLYDLHGLVWEWCLDYWHQNYQGSPTDGSAWLENYTNLARVLRGGSWLNFPHFCRCSTRHCLQSEYRSYYIGFRVVCQT